MHNLGALSQLEILFSSSSAKGSANVGPLDQVSHQMLQEFERFQLWLATSSKSIFSTVLICVITHEGFFFLVCLLLASLYVRSPEMYKKAVLPFFYPPHQALHQSAKPVLQEYRYQKYLLPYNPPVLYSPTTTPSTCSPKPFSASSPSP